MVPLDSVSIGAIRQNGRERFAVTHGLFQLWSWNMCVCVCDTLQSMSNAQWVEERSTEAQTRELFHNLELETVALDMKCIWSTRLFWNQQDLWHVTSRSECLPRQRHLKQATKDLAFVANLQFLRLLWKTFGPAGRSSVTQVLTS